MLLSEPRPPDREMVAAAWLEAAAAPEETQPLQGMPLRAEEEGEKYPDFSPPARRPSSSASHWLDLTGNH